MLSGVKPLKPEQSSVFACLLRNILRLLHHICHLTLRLSVRLGGDRDSPPTFYLVLVVLIQPPCTLTVSLTAAVNGLRLPHSCLLDVTFSPHCLGAIQVTLPELHRSPNDSLQHFWTWNDLLRSFHEAFTSIPPHAFTYSPFLSPSIFHILLFFHYVSFFHLVQYFISTTLPSSLSGQWGVGLVLSLFCLLFSLVCTSALLHFSHNFVRPAFLPDTEQLLKGQRRVKMREWVKWQDFNGTISQSLL